MTEEELPATWSRVILEDVADVGARTDLPDLDEEDEVSFVPMAAVAEESGIIELATRSYGSVAKGYTRFLEGDVLFAKITPCMENGKIAVARNLSDGIGFGTTELVVIRPKTDIDPDYLRLFLVQPRFRQTAERHMTGAVGQRRVPTPYLRAAELPLPPANEQRRIVERIDELFSQIEAGEAALARAKRLLARYRQAVLKAAVTGELTRDWRERHQAELEPAPHLLARILQTRREAWEKAELEKLRAKGKEPKDDKWKQKYKEPEPPDTTGLPELPEGWVWARVEMLSDGHESNGISIKGSDNPPGIMALRLDALTDSAVDFTARRYIPLPPNRFSQYAVRTGDFLVSRGNGSKQLVGRANLVEAVPEDCVFPDTIIRFRIIQIDGTSRWVDAVWKSEFVRAQIEARARTTAGIWKVSQGDLREIVVPLPPLGEVDAAVELLEQTISEITASKRAIELEQRRAAALRQAILTAAFAGKLVPQDPADEPAAALLERIRSRPRPSEVEAPGVLMPPRTTRKPRATMLLDRKAIKPDHLRAILAERGKPLKPHDLWQASDLHIDDFYKQLRDEIAAGRVIEDRKHETLTAAA